MITLLKRMTVITLVLLATYGCAGKMTKLNAYDGSTLNKNEQGFLKCAPDIRIISIDKNKKHSIPPQTSAFFTDCEIGLKPGTHTVEVCYEDDQDCVRARSGLIDLALRSADIHMGSECTPQQITIDIVPGRFYRIKPEIIINKVCQPGYTINTQYGQVISYSTKKEYEAKILIIDETDKETIQIYYNLAKLYSDKAKSQQSSNNWNDAVISWKSAIDNAVNGQLTPDIFLILQKNYSNALAATCQYDLALEHLAKAKEIDDTHDWSLDTTTLALARINLVANRIEIAKSHYDTMQSKYNNVLAKDEMLIINKLLNNNIITSSAISEELSMIDSDIEYGKHCQK